MIFSKMAFPVALVALFMAPAMSTPTGPVDVDNDVDNVAEASNPVTWNVKAHPDGPEVTLTGTVEEVYSQLVSMNPSYDEDWASVNATAPAILNDDDLKLGSQFTHYNEKDSLTCDFHPRAHVKTIQKGITYLRKVHGTPTMGPGPNACGRVSCSYNAAIFWCNTSKSVKKLPAYNNIADGAQVILNICINRMYDGAEFTSGLLHHNDDWDVIVRHDKC
ncbi:hypothetical protein BJX70DRAFT_194892 [Aspergillus crustosus]